MHDNITLIPISDAHIGDRAFDEKMFKRLVEHIRITPNVYAFLVGDLINNGTKNSKSDSYSEVLTPHAQKDRAIELLYPIKDKLLCSVSGNHEERTWRESAQDISKDIAKELNTIYDPFGILCHVHFGVKGKHMNYTFYTTHGSGGGGTIGNAANKLHSLRNICLSDLYIMGHTHKIISFKDVYYIPDTRHRTMVKQERHFAMAGSYLDYGGYAERLILSPTPTGFPVAELNGLKKKINITI